MTIQFNITEPMPCTRNVWLTLENGSGKRIRYAEPADVIAAIEANDELRQAVRALLGGDPGAWAAQTAALAEAQSRLREAERERDFQRDCRHREERELGAARERLVTIIDEAFGLQPVMGGTIDDMLTALEHHLFEQRKRCAEHLSKTEREREKLAFLAHGQKEEIAKLERELAEARALNEFSKSELGRWMQRYDEQAATIARLKLALTGSEGD